MKEINQYDQFLHKVQQPKMRELWDNKEDELLENYFLQEYRTQN